MVCHSWHLLLKPKLLICSVAVRELIKSVFNTTHSHSIAVTAARTWVDPGRTHDDFPPNDAVNLSWERRIVLIRAYFMGMWRKLLAKSINDILISAQVSSEEHPRRRMILWVSARLWFELRNPLGLCFFPETCVCMLQTCLMEAPYFSSQMSYLDECTFTILYILYYIFTILGGGGERFCCFSSAHFIEHWYLVLLLHQRLFTWAYLHLMVS